jgi:hypothetical protein
MQLSVIDSTSSNIPLKTLYHFNSKDDLIRELHGYIAQFSRGLIENELQSRNYYYEAFIYACLVASKSDEIKAYTVL